MDENMRCAYTGRPVEGSVDAIWDDGEWISWDFINQHLADTGQLEDVQDDGFDDDFIECDKDCDFNECEYYSIEEIFDRLVFLAKRYHEQKGRYLDIWRELGELYGEVQYGIKRHRENAQGSDGRAFKILSAEVDKAKGRVEIKELAAGKWKVGIAIDPDSIQTGASILIKTSIQFQETISIPLI